MAASVMLHPAKKAAAAETIVIPVTVKENNNIYVPAALYRRGFALPQGAAFSLDNFGLYTQGGEKVDSVFEITEKYSDGSVKWALCSFVTELKADELKKLEIRSDVSTETSKPVSVSVSGKTAAIRNESVSVEIDESGIKTLKSGAEGYIRGIGGYITLDGAAETEMRVSEIEVVKDTGLYAKVTAKGSFSDFARGEITVTLASGTQRAEIECRITARTDLNIYSMGMKILPSASADFSYSETAFSSGNVFGSDYICSADRGIYLITRDNKRFRGATTAENKTGFMFGSDAIRFAPIVNKKTFLWYDGLTRTTNLLVSFEKNAAEQIQTLENEPSVAISPQSFEKAGVIELSGSCAPIDSIISMVKFDVSKRDGRFDAGAMHYGINPEPESYSSLDTHPGEMEYNLGAAYMATAETDVYTVLLESARFWADVEIYKGDIEAIHGANRYRTGPMYYNERFRTSHPYYGDSSGLYMAYVLSGDEYLRDIYKMAVEHIYRNMYTSDKNMGFHYPHMYQWYTGSVICRNYVESRYIIQIRPLYLAYGLFEDEKFRTAALEIVHWAYAAQSEDGWWYQAIYDDGKPLRQNGQTQDAVKTYVWMYGARGISFISRYEKDDEIVTVLKRIGDFIGNEYKNYGKGLWKPTGNAALYECDEDNTRGKGPYEDIMGIELLYRAYRMTGETKYLNSLLGCVETWFSSMNPSGASVLLANLEGRGTNLIMGGGQNYTLLMIFPELRKLMKTEAQKIKSLGYDYLLTVFDEGTRVLSDIAEKPGIIEPEVTQIIFENNGKKVLFATNYAGYLSGNYEKDYKTVIHDGALWTGAENLVSIPGTVTLKKHLKQFDRILAMSVPIYVTALSDDVSVYIDEYSENKIVFRMYGNGEVNVRADSGTFAIKDGENYSVTTKRSGDNGIEVKICKNCIRNLKSASDGLKFKVTLKKNVSLSDTDSVASYAAVSAGLMSADNSVFNPEGEADNAEFESSVEKLTGVKKNFEGKTFADAAAYTLSVIDTLPPDFLSQNGISPKHVTVIGNGISDEEAVRCGAAALRLPEYEKLGGDIELPAESAGGTSVEWKSDNPSVLSEKGVYTRTNSENLTVRLTATIKKGAASAEKVFEIPVMGENEVCWYSDTMTVPESKHELNTLTGDIEINCTVTPLEDNTNAVMGFSSTYAVTNQFTDFPMIVRFSPDGVIDAYNGNSYAAAERLTYKKDKKYNVKIRASVAAKTYSVSVTDEDGKTYAIAKDFAFRGTAPEIGMVDVVYIPAAKSGGRLFVIESMDAAKQTKDEKLSEPAFDENGLMFGRYAEGSVYLPPYSGEKETAWLSADESIITSKGTVALEHGTADTMLCGVTGSPQSEIKSAADVLKKINLIENANGDSNPLTRENQAQLLNALRYVLNSIK